MKKRRKKIALWIMLASTTLFLGCGFQNSQDAPVPLPEVSQTAAEPEQDGNAAGEQAVSDAGESAQVETEQDADVQAVSDAGESSEAEQGEETAGAQEQGAQAKTDRDADVQAVSGVGESAESEQDEDTADASVGFIPEPGSPESTPESEPDEALIDESGTYTSCEDVALYLKTYGRLPDNFITKKEAQALGWEGGSLEPYAPGKCIGGDKFGNYEGNLPKKKGRVYYECDIGTLKKKSRGAKRIVYSNDGLIYYTEDHYETFTLLYE